MNIYFATYELLSGELALLGRLELPGDNEYGPGGGVQVQVLQEPHHTLHPCKVIIIRMMSMVLEEGSSSSNTSNLTTPYIPVRVLFLLG